MDQQKIIDEVNYHKAQTITESLYKSGAKADRAEEKTGCSLLPRFYG